MKTDVVFCFRPSTNAEPGTKCLQRGKSNKGSVIWAFLECVHQDMHTLITLLEALERLTTGMLVVFLLKFIAYFDSMLDVQFYLSQNSHSHGVCHACKFIWLIQFYIFPCRADKSLTVDWNVQL